VLLLLVVLGGRATDDEDGAAWRSCVRTTYENN